MAWRCQDLKVPHLFSSLFLLFWHPLLPVEDGEEKEEEEKEEKEEEKAEEEKEEVGLVG